MVAYIKQIAEDLAQRLQFPDRERQKEIAGRVQVLREELDRLDPLDFAPTAVSPSQICDGEFGALLVSAMTLGTKC